MEEQFDLNIFYNNQERIYPALFQKFGYSYRITVTVDDVEVYFEPDEERNFRAIIKPEFEKSLDPKLIQVIGQTLEEALK